MTSDAIIEAAARRLHEAGSDRVSWDATSAFERDTCRAGARALAAAGLLATESPGEPLPAGQVRREPDTSNAWHRIGKADEWFCAHPDIDIRLTDDDVRDWPVLVPEAAIDGILPEAALDDLRGERDRFLARVAELEATEPHAVDADALAKAINKAHDVWGGQVLADTIRERLPATTRPALPEGHIALDMSGWTEDGLQDLSEMRPDAGTTIAAANIASAAARAELARRAADAGVSS